MDTRSLEKELLAGLDGVTDGPWQVIPTPGADDEPMFVLMAQPSPALRGFTFPIAWAGETNINHFARCSPDNIRALLATIAELRAAVAEAGWRTMDSAPKNSKDVLLRIPCNGWPGYYVQVGHWAQDLSGSEQPPFSGWFRNTGYGFASFSAEPTGWAPFTAPSDSPATAKHGGSNAAE